MTTATATPSCKVIRSRADTRPAGGRADTDGGRPGWPSGRRTPPPLGPRSSRSAFTAGLALLVGTVGVVGFGQLGPAGVIAQQLPQLRAGRRDQPLPLDLLQVALPGLGGVQAEGGADLGPAVALRTGLAHRLPAPADQLVDHLPVGRQRLRGPGPWVHSGYWSKTASDSPRAPARRRAVRSTSASDHACQVSGPPP
jgi:hypothetical protein